MQITTINPIINTNMKKLLLLPLLLAAMNLFAAQRVEDFTPKSGTGTAKAYETSATTIECSEASWTVFYGGIQQNLGKMGSTNWASVVRAKYADETYDGFPYIQSSTIEGGIDSLWFTWNSNGGETGYTWKVKVYVNDVEVGSIEEAGGSQISAAPFRTFQSKGNLNITGDFVIKIVNESSISVSTNKLRLVVDDLGWITKPQAGEKTTPSIEFAEDALIKKIDAEPFTNALNTNSDATPAYVSSKPEVATVDNAGKVTIVGLGTTTITASVAETETYKAAETSYTLRVVPLNFHMETFDGANNVDLSTNNTYLTTPTESFEASTATGIKWTTLLGSIRNSLGGSSASNLAAVVRAKKNAEENYGYLLSATIQGGIDSLAFEWNANGTEASRTKNWDIDIYINDTKVGSINDKGQAIQPMGSWFRFGVGNLKTAGDFTIKIVNNNVPDDGSGNQYRWVVDNIEWYSYEAPAPEHIYSVAGVEALMGVKWKADDTNAEMALQNDGTYKLVRENVELAKGTYDYKVVIDHKWDNGEAQANSTLNIDKSGIYDVTFTYDPTKPETGAVADLKQEIVILPTLTLAGGFNSWNQENFTPAEDKLTATITKTIALGDWGFKVVVNGAWLGEGQTITRANNSTTVNLDGQDMTLSADHPGDYTFTWIYATNTLTVTYPDDGTPAEHIYSLAGSPALFGLYWDPTGDFNMVKQNDGKYTYLLEDIELAKGNYEYKVVIDHKWDNGEAADNSVVVIDKAGIYDITFTYDPSEPKTSSVATLKQELVILPEVDLAGAFNNWVQNDAFTPAEDKLTATITKDLTAGDYNFKVIVATSWLGAEQVFTRANNSYVVDSNGQDMKLVADCDGTYLFTWTYATNQLDITFPVGTNIDSANAARTIRKQILDGQLVITVNGISYNAQGELIR